MLRTNVFICLLILGSLFFNNSALCDDSNKEDSFFYQNSEEKLIKNIKKEIIYSIISNKKSIENRDLYLIFDSLVKSYANSMNIKVETYAPYKLKNNKKEVINRFNNSEIFIIISRDYFIKEKLDINIFFSRMKKSGYTFKYDRIEENEKNECTFVQAITSNTINYSFLFIPEKKSYKIKKECVEIFSYESLGIETNEKAKSDDFLEKIYPRAVSEAFGLCQKENDHHSCIKRKLKSINF
ncbi:hypothetical protein [Cohaesibacter marisflavi]|uniref:hypothetical protein n=1 Tax=Cohaesibacter marisflavi TaxID=655353 RepID=UPI0029C71705|nr:hypothetical protein [Cohaesibacter marisflavi]